MSQCCSLILYYLETRLILPLPCCYCWCSSCWRWSAWLNDSSPSKSHVTAPALDWNLQGLPSISASQCSGVPELRELKCWYNIVFCASCLWRLQNDTNINKKDQLKMQKNRKMNYDFCVLRKSRVKHYHYTIVTLLWQSMQWWLLQSNVPMCCSLQKSWLMIMPHPPAAVLL